MPSPTKRPRGRPRRDVAATPFARRLTALLQRRGWSIVQLAERSGVKNDMIGDYLAGEVQPPLPAAQALAAALGVSLDALAGGKK